MRLHLCVWRCKCRRVFVLTDLLNTPVLVNTQHNHWTVTCQIRAYAVHYTHPPSLSLSLSLDFRHTFKLSFLSHIKHITHITPVVSSSNHMSYHCSAALPPFLLAALCLIIMVSNVSMYPCVDGGQAAAAPEKKGSAVVIGHDEVWPVG